MKALQRFAEEYPALTALLAGGLATLAFAPFGLWPLAVLSPLLLFWFWLRQSRQGFRLGFYYGLGFMGSGISWLHVSIAQFGHIGWLLPLIITAGFVLLIAFFYGLLGWLTRYFSGPDWLKAIAVFPALWVLVEWLRGWLFTGFPWLQLGYAMIDSPLAGYGPILGVLGMSWLVVLSAGMLLALLNGTRRISLLIYLALIWAAGLGYRQLDWSEPAGAQLRVALIQGNIPQEQKWEIEQLLPSLTLYATLSKENFDRDLIVWPETAVSAFQYQVDEPFIVPMEEAIRKNGSHLVFGVVRLDDDGTRYYNTMVALGGEARDDYFKRHLVPFTEYLPLKNLLWPLIDFFTIPMSDFTPGDKPQPLMRVGDYQVGMSICYEDAFGTEMIQALPQAAYLINASNDAWFGDSLAPRQHLQMARMRSLESGRYLLRATNTGISAIIGPKGELQAHSPLQQVDVLKGEIRPMQGMTPYARWGNSLVLALLAVALLLGRLLGGRRESVITQK